MGAVKPGQKEYIVPVQGNAVSVFVDTEDGLLKLKDNRGNVQDITDYTSAGSKGAQGAKGEECVLGHAPDTGPE